MAAIDDLGSLSRGPAGFPAEGDEELERWLDAYAASSTPHVHAVLAARGEQALIERYYHGFGSESYHRLNSVTKSVVSILAGIVAGDGLVALDDPLDDVVPGLAPRSRDPRRRSLSFRHLLSMTTGFDRRMPPGGFYGSPEPARQALGRRLRHEPGRRFRYDNPGADLVAFLLEELVGEPLPRFARRRLFEPLGIWADLEPFAWRRGRSRPRNSFSAGCEWDERDGTPWKTHLSGQAKGAYGLHLRARELLRLGLLARDGGAWNGTQLVPVWYMAEAVGRQSGGGPPARCPYGFLWWLSREDERPAFYALGYGGQCIYVARETGIVVVTLVSSHTRSGWRHRAPLVETIHARLSGEPQPLPALPVPARPRPRRPRPRAASRARSRSGRSSSGA